MKDEEERRTLGRLYVCYMQRCGSKSGWKGYFLVEAEAVELDEWKQMEAVSFLVEAEAEAVEMK